MIDLIAGEDMSHVRRQAHTYAITATLQVC